MSHYSDGAVLATDLVNTYGVFGSVELLGAPAAVVSFAADHGFETGPVAGRDLERIRAARSVLRSAMLSDDEAAAVATLNDLFVTTRPRPRLVESSDGAWAFAYADPGAGLADRLLAEATAEVLIEIRDHGLSRFATCGSSTCEDVFVDQSRNHSRRYCTPEVCGNREAQRAYRARRAERDPK